ncbi:MAG: phosphoglycerate dehydrogenase [Phycisphaerales bacterium]
MPTPSHRPFPKQRVEVVLAESIHPRAVELCEAEGFKVRAIRPALSERDVIDVLRSAHVLGIRSKTDVSAGALSGAKRLLAVGCFCIGTNQVDLASACAAGVPVFNSPFSNTRSVAELTIAEIVMLARGIFAKSHKMHRGEWDKSAAGSHEVRGRTLGIVGYGHIGSQVSVLAESMGMRVIFHDILPKLALGNARRAGSLGELLNASDIVTLHVPATPQTTNMIAAREIAKMKEGAMLINNARGSIVDIAALASALKQGKLAGAAIDVFPHEPSGAAEMFQSPLRGIENVILTPHIGGSTEEAQESIAQDVCLKLIRFVNNGSTTGAVNVPQVELPEQDAPHRDTDAGAAKPTKREGAGETRRHRILHFHRNQPGVLKKLNSIAADLGVNIAAQYLQTNESIGYVVLDVDPTDGVRLTDGFKKIEETIRVRLLW